MESMDMGTTTMAHDMMDMMTTTASAAMSTGTEMAMGGMDHDMAGMDHGMDSGPGPACKVSVRHLPSTSFDVSTPEIP